MTDAPTPSAEAARLRRMNETAIPGRTFVVDEDDVDMLPQVRLEDGGNVGCYVVILEDEEGGEDALGTATARWLAALLTAYRSGQLLDARDPSAMRAAGWVRRDECRRYRDDGMALAEAVATMEGARFLGDDKGQSDAYSTVVDLATDYLASRDPAVSGVAADTTPTEPAPSGWRPIETAPKDGRVILGRWSDEDIATIAYRDGSWIWTMDGDGWRDNLGPGHWMPLPPPPADTTPQEGS